MGSKKKGAVEIIALQCTECKRKNYTTYKNRKNITGKLEKNKYCPFCKKSIALEFFLIFFFIIHYSTTSSLPEKQYIFSFERRLDNITPTL